MKLKLNEQLATNYKSRSQKDRVLTEQWVDNSIFCPNCGHLEIDKFPNNRPVADFYCSNCREEYELKSKQSAICSKIVDGAYHTMIERLASCSNPNFFLLNYSLSDFEITNFFVIPKHFIVPNLIEKREPLAKTARRAGWIGCNILIQNIPQAGKIYFIKNGFTRSKELVLAEWKRTLFLRDEREITTKGWLLDVMRVIEKLGKREFALVDIYSFESEFSKLHPENMHIKEKIRQQLQILRDKGFLNSTVRGLYEVR